MNEEDFKNKLNKEQYKVLREKGTEAPFSGKLIHPDKDGFYKCAACGNPLFKAEAKFVITAIISICHKKFQME